MSADRVTENPRGGIFVNGRPYGCCYGSLRDDCTCPVVTEQGEHAVKELRAEVAELRNEVEGLRRLLGLAK